MTRVTIAPTLQNKLDQFAEFVGRSPETLVEEALQAYLEALSTQKLEAEIAAWEHLYPNLRDQYPGQYVAIHQGEVVDADRDFETLFERVDARFGELTILIRRVGENSEEVWQFRSPRWGGHQ